MKIRDKKELHTKSINDLKSIIEEARQSLLSFRLEKAQNKLKNTRAIFLKKKDIARMMTILAQKEFVNEKNT